MTNTQNQS